MPSPDTTPPLDSDDWIERFATTTACARHIPQTRACRYQGGEPCACRAYRDMTREIIAKDCAAAICRLRQMVEVANG